MHTKNIFFVGLILAASGLISTPLALLAGLIYGLSFSHPYHLDAKKLSAFLLQASIVGLGFGMNLQEVLRAGRSGRQDRIFVHGVEHKLCDAYRPRDWTISQGPAQTVALDQCGHRDLWRKRNRSRRPRGKCG
jgi:hypothetical protein